MFYWIYNGFFYDEYHEIYYEIPCYFYILKFKIYFYYFFIIYFIPLQNNHIHTVVCFFIPTIYHLIFNIFCLIFIFITLFLILLFLLSLLLQNQNFIWFFFTLLLFFFSSSTRSTLLLFHSNQLWSLVIHLSSLFPQLPSSLLVTYFKPPSFLSLTLLIQINLSQYNLILPLGLTPSKTILNQISLKIKIS